MLLYHIIVLSRYVIILYHYIIIILSRYIIILYYYYIISLCYYIMIFRQVARTIFAYDLEVFMPLRFIM